MIQFIKANRRRIPRLIKLLGLSGTLSFLAASLSGKQHIALHPKGASTPVTIRPGDSDVRVLVQIFLLGEFDLPPELKPKTILDAGANIGASARYFLDHYPEATLVAVEPDPANAALVKQNTAGSDVTVLNSGLWSEDGHVKVSNPGAESWALEFEPAEASEPGAVECLSVASVMQRTGIERFDLVKLDIEGAERNVFRDGNLDWLDRCGMLIIETHGDDIDRLVKDTLAARGFDLAQQGEKVIATHPERAA